MFILNILVDHALILIIIATILLVVGKLLPLPQYAVPLKYVGILILVAGVFFSGRAAEKEIWVEKENEAKWQIAGLEAKAAAISTDVVIKYVDRIQYITKIETVKSKEFVTPTADSKCAVNNGFVRLHDSVVNGTPIEPSVTDENTSTIKLSDVAETVKKNYINGLKNIEQLTALQEWINKQRANK